MTTEPRNTPVSTPSGPSAGLEGQDATQETQDATEAAQRRFCGYAITDTDGEQQPCDRPATGWRWYQDVGEHEDLLAVACDWHANEGGRVIAELRAEVERLRKPTVAAVMGYELGAGDLERAEARVAEMEAAVARGLALADEWAAIDGDGMTIPWPVADSLMHKAAADLRAILDAPKGTTAP